MLHDDLAKAINEAFEDFVGELGPYNGAAVELRVAHDNEPFEPPIAKPWAKLSFSVPVARQKSFGSPGSNRVRKEGTVKFQVFTPVSEGTGLADFIVRKMESQLSDVTIAGVRYRTVRTPESRRQNNEWVTSVEIPFQADRLA